jgi:hypothetical protein
MTYENDARDLSEDGKELGDERATADEDGDEDDEEAFRKIIDAVENHDGDISLLHSGTGMYLLGMTFGWAALRVFHTRKAALNYKKILGITTHSLAFPHGGPFPRDGYKALA